MLLVLPNKINVCQAKANVAEGLLILLPPCTPRLSRVMLSELLLTCCSHGGCCTGREPKYNCYPAAHWWQTGRWPVSVPRCCCRAATCCAGNLCFQQGPRKPLGDYERGGLRRFVGGGGDVASSVEHGWNWKALWPLRQEYLHGLGVKSATADWGWSMTHPGKHAVKRAQRPA